MPIDFKWNRPGFDLVKLNFKWNVQVPFLYKEPTEDDDDEHLDSTTFPSQDGHWKLLLFNAGEEMVIKTRHYKSSKKSRIVAPVMVKMSILNGKEEKIFQEKIPSNCGNKDVEIVLSKDAIQFLCQPEDDRLTFCCTIYSHVKKEPLPSLNPVSDLIDGLSALSHEFEGLFDRMQFSDVIFKVRGREFSAHKSILSARSEVFAAMFQHLTKENSTNQIEIEDIEPEVFHQLLRYIYTGRVFSEPKETIPFGLYIAADKYLLDQLKISCEKYLLRRISPSNCVEILCHGDLPKPAEHLMKAAIRFFRRFPSQVVATENWKKMKEDNPRLTSDIQEAVFCCKS